MAAHRIAWRVPAAVRASQSGTYAKTSPPFFFARTNTWSPCSRLMLNRVASEMRKPGVEHQPDQVLQVLTGPLASAGLVLPLDLDLVAGGDDPVDLVVGERRLVGGAAGADRRLDVGADRRLGDPLPVDAEPEERPQRRQALALGARSQLPVRPEPVDVVGRDLVEHHVAAGRPRSRESAWRRCGTCGAWPASGPAASRLVM